MTVSISAGQVKELRERTGAGMMECKKALTATAGDMEKAIEELRKAGITKAGKKAGRIAAEGMVAVIEKDDRVAMIEVNSETDFVAKDINFVGFVKAVAEGALVKNITDVAALSASRLNDSDPATVEDLRHELVSKVGENVQIRRIVISKGTSANIGTYTHGSRIGVMVELDIPNKDLARDIAMHIAASRPSVIAPEDVSAEDVAKEKEIYMAQAATSGKPQEIIEKMVLGRLKKYLDEVSLMGQPFVKDPDTTVGNLLAKHKAKVIAFHRFEVGEGIEKVVEDFKDAVMSQVQGS